MASDDEVARRSERPAERVGERSGERVTAPERSGERAAERTGERPAVAPERPSPPPHDDHDDLPDTIRHRLERLVPELVKKTVTAGLGAVFSTEEGIRKLARESLPEVAGYIASSADGAKDKVFDVIARETREFLSTLNLTDEIAKILTTLSLEIKTEIRFIPNSERVMGAEPDVKASMRIKRAEDKDKDKDKDKDSKEKDRERDKDDTSSRDSRSRLRFWQRDKDGRDGDGGDDGGSDKPDK